MNRSDSRDSMISMTTKREQLKTLNEAIKYPKFSHRKDLQERNEQMYEFLAKKRICVLPDPSIRSIDYLPQFEFIESVRSTEHDKHMLSLKKESTKRLQKMSIASILDERTIGGRNANLSLKDLDRQLNDFQLFQARKKRKNFPCLH